MIVEISRALGKPFVTMDYPQGTTLGEIYSQIRTEEEYDAFAANVNNDIKPMNYVIHRNCRIQFLDIRSMSSFLIYQNSLTMLFLSAAQDVLDGRPIEVRTTICDGVYIEFGEAGIRQNEIRRIGKKMDELVAGDCPIERDGNDYTLDGFTARFYNLMVPSAGYLKRFELRKYKKGLLLRYPQINDPNTIPEFHDDGLMYGAFREQDRWNDILGVHYISDINEKVRRGECREMIKLSEALHDKKVVEIADEITKRGKRIILILGPSSSGKTTTAKRLAIQLMVNGLRPFYVSTDDYFLERSQTPRDENGEYNFEGIDAIDIELFNKQMNDLLAGREVDIPTFDFISGKKIYGKRVTRLESDQPIIIEGIHSFNPHLTGGIPDGEKYKIYISPLTQFNIDSINRIPKTDARLIRRMVRDSWSRNNDAAMTLRNWNKVRDGEAHNIFPYCDEADVFFNTVHVYEVCVLKKYAVALLKKVTRDLPEYGEAQRLLRYLDTVESFNDEDLIASDSILREFIGGSIYAK